MSLSAAVLRELMAAGLSGDALLAAAERIEQAEGRPADALEKRRQYDRERKRAKKNSTGNPPEKAETKAAPISANSTGNPPEIHRSPRARVEDNLLTTREPCLSLSLDFARDCAGASLASPARAHGVMVLRELMRCEAEGCTIDEIGDGIREAAAWYLNRDGPGSMTTWTLAAKIARQHRDRRLNPPPVVVPMERPNERSNPAAKRVERHGNYARSFAGLEAVALARAGDG